MKIKHVSCKQFAGIRDRNFTFADGVNILYGANESGKSTLVRLISRLFFQNARLNRITDKKFIASSFPCDKKGAASKGDFANGTITFTDGENQYILEKEWSDGPRYALNLNGERIRNKDQIDALLKEVLLYGDGVYSNLLFLPQKDAALSLQTLLDASQKSSERQEIVDTVTRAFAQTDGISMDQLEQKISQNIEEIAGKHWDAERSQPDRHPGQWKQDLGQILKAYYDWEKAVQNQKKRCELEEKADRAGQVFRMAEAEEKKAETESKQFRDIADALTFQRNQKDRANACRKELEKAEQVLQNWPLRKANREQAEALQSEQEKRTLLDCYGRVKAIEQEQEGLDMAALAMACPTAEEIQKARKLSGEIERLQNQLCGMNLNALIQMQNGHEIEIRSLRTGELLKVSEGCASIGEAVQVTIPGVMSMTLSPADVNPAEIQEQIAQREQEKAGILQAYQTRTPEDLQALQTRIRDARSRQKDIERQLEIELDGKPFEELRRAAERISGEQIRSKEEIERAISALCGGSGLTKFLAEQEAFLEAYEKEYAQIETLQTRIAQLKKEQNELTVQLEQADGIPEQYRTIQDPAAHEKRLEERLEACRGRCIEAREQKVRAENDLDRETQNSEDIAEQVQMAAERLENTKKLLAHWKHIQSVLNALKEKLHDNPVQDIADRFAQNLDVISGGTITSEFANPDKLDMNIYSDDWHLDYDKLSEGTKDTVSLAFRLAVLDHLFPDGGGVIVFDDPFTDMDAQRCERSCKLISEYGTRHQILFLTCREEYLDLLDGTVIRM